MLLSLAGTLTVGSLAASASAESAKPEVVSASSPKVAVATSSIRPDQLLKLLQQEKYERIYGQLGAEFKKQFSLKDFKKQVSLNHKNVTSYKLVSHFLINNTSYYAWKDPKGEKRYKLCLTERTR